MRPAKAPAQSGRGVSCSNNPDCLKATIYDNPRLRRAALKASL